MEAAIVLSGVLIAYTLGWWMRGLAGHRQDGGRETT